MYKTLLPLSQFGQLLKCKINIQIKVYIIPFDLKPTILLAQY